MTLFHTKASNADVIFESLIFYNNSPPFMTKTHTVVFYLFTDPRPCVNNSLFSIAARSCLSLVIAAVARATPLIGRCEGVHSLPLKPPRIYITSLLCIRLH